MNDDGRRQSVKAYFDGIAAKDMSRVPWKQGCDAARPTQSRKAARAC